MPFEKLLKYFSDITICKIRPTWCQSRYASFFYDYSNRIESYMIEVTQPGLHEIELELFTNGRVNECFDRTADPEIDLCLIICKWSQSGLECVAYEQKCDVYINLSATLTCGRYTVFATSIKAISIYHKEKQTLAETNWFSYNLVFHSQQPVLINPIQQSSGMVSDLFFSVARLSQQVKYYLNESVRVTMIAANSCYAILVENLNRLECVQVKLDAAKSKNVELSRLSKLTADHLCPCTRLWVAFIVPVNLKKRYTIKVNTDINFSSHLCHAECTRLASELFSGLFSTRNIEFCWHLKYLHKNKINKYLYHI